MSFVRVSSSTEIDKLYFCRKWSLPFANAVLATWVLPREIAWVIYVTASLWTIDASLILYLLKITLNASKLNLRLGIIFHQWSFLFNQTWAVCSQASDQYGSSGESAKTRSLVRIILLFHEPGLPQILCNYCLWWSHINSFQVVQTPDTYY